VIDAYIQQVVGRSAKVQWVLDNWQYPPKVDDLRRRREYRVSSLSQMLRPGSQVGWPATLEKDLLLQNGIYSPTQPLIWECARAVGEKETGDRTDLEHPFHFSLLALFIRTLLDQMESGDKVQQWPPSADVYTDIRKVLQAVFQLREMREEREQLSLEIRFPLTADTKKESLELKQMAQLYGRGAGFVSGPELAAGDDGKVRGHVEKVFEDHEGTASSSLYELSPTLSHIKERDVHLVLRRDGHVLVAVRENPLLEFYDGGWHVVDLQSGRVAIDTLLDNWFPRRRSQVAEYSLRLAYHMGTHWHGGILAVAKMKVGKRNLKLQDPSEEALKAQRSLVQLAGGKMPKITEVEKTRLGRILLTCALQDGAVLIGADAGVQRVGTMVAQSRNVEEGGARRRAAKTFGEFGVAIAISHDGAIRLFSGHGGRKLLPPEGLRIH
jgi:hypothetical protein